MSKLDFTDSEILSCQKCSGTGHVYVPEDVNIFGMRDKGRGFFKECDCKFRVRFSRFLGDFSGEKTSKNLSYPNDLNLHQGKALLVRAFWAKFKPYFVSYLYKNAEILSDEGGKPLFKVLRLFDMDATFFKDNTEIKNVVDILDKFSLLVVCMEFNYTSSFSPDSIKFVASSREDAGRSTWIVTPKVGMQLRQFFAPDESHHAYTKAKKLEEYLNNVPVVNKNDEYKWG